MCCGGSYQQSGVKWGIVGFIRILAPRFKQEQSD